mmetsp:Transcript_30071/g.34100  ORF Transcript_30071/g.34100 Transcript_30071/m.34100 type:complete len:273 (-) Transcript_30071:430-1248(-)
MLMQTQQQQLASAFTQPHSHSQAQQAFAPQATAQSEHSLSPPSPSQSQLLPPHKAALQLEQRKKQQQQQASSDNNRKNREDIKVLSVVRTPVLPRPRSEMTQQLRFPWKLHLLLEQCELQQQHQLRQHQQQQGCVLPTDTGLPVIVSWLPDGKSFKVHDKIRFVKEIMPSFFGTQSFKTFQRNLNLWGFTRISKGPHKDICSHPLFLKGFPSVCQSMKRIVLKGTGRGNRAPLGGVDVSSVQAVVAQATAAARAAQVVIQQQQQQQQRQRLR